MCQIVLGIWTRRPLLWGPPRVTAVSHMGAPTQCLLVGGGSSAFRETDAVGSIWHDLAVLLMGSPSIVGCGPSRD